MFSTRKTITIVALAAAGVLSVGAVASAQAQSGSVPTSDHRTPATSGTPSVGDDNGLRGDGTVDDDSALPVTPTTVPAPSPSTGLPTDADHPQGDDSIGRGDGDDANEADDVDGDDSHSGVSDDGAGHDAGDDHGQNRGGDRGDDSGHGSDDSGHSGSRH